MPRAILFSSLGILTICILIACKESTTSPTSTAPTTNEHPAYTHTKKIVSFGPRPPQSAALKKSRDYISSVLAENGWQSATQTFTAPTPRGTVTFVNLIARFGKDDPDIWKRPITGIVGAHLDSKLMPPPNRFVGADDAASACGVILELSRTLAENPEHAKQLELVFFDGEEALGAVMTERDGIYGSRAYAQRWQKSAQKPQWGVILDMIGHQNLSIKLPSDSPPHLVERLMKVVEEEGVAELYGMAPGPILDDHVPLNAVGIPSIDIIGDFTASTWWHTNEDNISLISEESLEISQRVAEGFINDLLSTTE